MSHSHTRVTRRIVPPWSYHESPRLFETQIGRTFMQNSAELAMGPELERRIYRTPRTRVRGTPRLAGLFKVMEHKGGEGASRPTRRDPASRILNPPCRLKSQANPDL